MEDYDNGIVTPPYDPVMHDILNSNISLDEINSAIRPLKNGKCPGIDFFPAEFLKAGIESLSPILQLMYNYFLENRHFPSCWCEGLSIALFKAGDRLDPACYRKLTILPAFEKVFEIMFNNRFEFVNEAFNKIDQQNGRFLRAHAQAIISSLYKDLFRYNLLSDNL